MPYFFNGRLWISPATMSVVDDSALANTNLTVSNVAAFIGSSIGGEPNTILTFGSPSEAQAKLIGGELCNAVMKAFSPSTETGAPSTVVAVRVNPALQSSLVVNDTNAAACINLTSADWGNYTNQIMVSFAAGSTQGVKATSQIGSEVYSQDNIYSAPFSIQYTGGQSTATMTITDTTVTLDAPSGTPVATISLATFPTIAQLVDYINTVPSFTAAVLNGQNNAPALNGLDALSAHDVKTAVYSATATLQAVINWFNSQSQSLVVAARATNAALPPAALGFTFLTGGSDGTITNTQWGNAFTTLQTAGVQWLTPISSNQAIVAMGDAHCQYMSTVGRKERRQIAGTALSTDDATAIADALAINSDRTSLVHIGYYDYDITNNLTGLQLYSPYLLAAIIAAAFSGVNPGTPMTNKAVAIRGVERELLNPTETDPLITGGVMCVEKTTSGYKVVKSISTWLINTNYDKVEQSVGWALDFVAQNVRNALDVLRGAKNNSINLARAVSITESQLRLLAKQEPAGPGVLAGDAANPPYLGITASAIGDVLAVSFQCSPVLPINYIPVTIFAVPFTGTASA